MAPAMEETILQVRQVAKAAKVPAPDFSFRFADANRATKPAESLSSSQSLLALRV